MYRAQVEIIRQVVQVHGNPAMEVLTPWHIRRLHQGYSLLTGTLREPWHELTLSALKLVLCQGHVLRRFEGCAQWERILDGATVPAADANCFIVCFLVASLPLVCLACGGELVCESLSATLAFPLSNLGNSTLA